MIRKVLRGIRYVVMGIFVAGAFVPIALFVGMILILDKILAKISGEEERVNSKQKKRG